MSEKIPMVSVVITTKNEEANIEICLQSIKLQTYTNIEIIVVDNFSQDKTCNLALGYTDLVYSKGPERSSQRNFGMIEIAKGVYGIYIDADMVLSPNLIGECVKMFNSGNIDALHIPEIVLGKGYFSRVRSFERSFYDGTAIDGARFFLRDAFWQAGGFDERLFREGSGEDWDIDKRLKLQGRTISLLPKYSSCMDGLTNWPLAEFIVQRGVQYRKDYIGIYHNESDFHLGSYLRKKLYYARGFDGYIARWGRKDPDIQKQFGLIYRYFTVFLENGKWKNFISRVDLIAGLYFLRFLVGVIYLFSKLKRYQRRK